MVVGNQLINIVGEKGGVLGLGEMQKEMLGFGRMGIEIKLGFVGKPIAIISTHVGTDFEISGIVDVDRRKIKI